MGLHLKTRDIIKQKKFIAFYRSFAAKKKTRGKATKQKE